MPKKPLSMYMLFYSEKREQILAENPSLSMPEVAKICSEQYQVNLQLFYVIRAPVYYSGPWENILAVYTGVSVSVQLQQFAELYKGNKVI